ncbi:MAG TPA: response regulator transcription factor [Casimicrobiaceae bacterium]|nr:response regulator transcription factor [Casimicrobiaceae bacterium]
MISVLLVDDHAVVREGYKRLIERSPDLRVGGEASTASGAYRAFVETDPDVTVMDISLPDLSGIEVLRHILARCANARVLMFSIHDETIYAERALAAGARGYLTKASAPDLLVEAVRTVVQGEVFLSPDVFAALDARSTERIDDAIGTLSTREFEIFRQLVNGLSVRQIAERLCLTCKTVSNYQTAIRQKLGAPTLTHLLQIAVRCGVATSTWPASPRGSRHGATPAPPRSRRTGN